MCSPAVPQEGYCATKRPILDFNCGEEVLMKLEAVLMTLVYLDYVMEIKQVM